MKRIITNKSTCKTCLACYNICKQNAIEIHEDRYGNKYPIINKKKCINCKQCRNVCPEINAPKFENIKKTIAAYSKNENIRQNCNSGGIASTFYTSILKKDGIVYGVSNISTSNGYYFTRINKCDQIEKLKGSKYVQADLGEIFQKVRTDLKNRSVIFIGTPCQIAGLKKFLIKDYTNLITVDLLCHGVPNSKMLLQELQSNNIKIDDVGRIIFRDGKNYVFKIIDKYNKIILNQTIFNNKYLRGFLNGYILKEACYSCQYAQQKRISDITLGDFWSLDSNSKITNDRGVSLILINTDRGLEFFNNNNEEIVFEERSLEEAISGNDPLKSPCHKRIEYYIFRFFYNVFSYKITMIIVDSFQRLKNKIKKLIRVLQKR